MIECDARFPDWVKLLGKGYIDSGFAGRVSRLPVDSIVKDMLSDRRADEQIEALSHWVALQGKRILEIGSGCGAFVVRGRAGYGLDVYGVEPSLGEFSANLSVCREMLDHFAQPADCVLDAQGEALPFADNSFDVVHSSNVLEHVADPEKTLAEAMRVLRPGGLLHIVVPNYGSWWEGHYGILWWPNLSRRMAKLYTRLLGRDPAYVDTLNLIDHAQMKTWTDRFGRDIEILDWGWSTFEKRVRDQATPKWGALALAGRVVGLLHKMKLVSLGLAVAKRLHWETPVILVARKRMH
ncbi:class I SAM-dependent methyltransferase [Dongia soli]|uniref:Class I SAM-dependent methyltransferase n=1 Tax=Dongia soli TaxID=600628 RepID=A0ABU5EEU1_9PROT|nr:class I SAM-dependent methyltransferase [Dongia soli]MDY0884060.1 class I SAM-dependent methyltransferase [Dongia soli]